MKTNRSESKSNKIMYKDIVKLNRYLMVIMIFLPIFKPDISGQANFKKIEKVSSSITLLNTESDISFDTGFYKGLTEEDYDKEIDILDLKQLINLARFAKKNLPRIFDAPKIIMQIKSNFIKNHEMIIVKDTLPNPTHVSQLVFILDKDGKNICRMGRFDIERYKITCNLISEEIDCFNKFIMKENLVINDPDMALEIFRLYLTLDRNREINIIDDVDNFIKKICDNVQNMKVPFEVQKKIYAPVYCQIADVFRIKFFTFELFKNNLFVDCWDVNISKKGVIKPNFHEYFKIEL